MNGSEQAPWLPFWKTQASAKREKLSQFISQAAATSGGGAYRTVLLQKLKAAADSRKSWAEAIRDHYHSVGQILDEAPSAAKINPEKKSRGSFSSA